MPRRSRLAARPRLEILDDRCLLSALTPTLLASAYGLGGISFSNGAVKGTGEGQTIAIVDAYNDPTIAADLSAFDQKYGLANPTTTTSPASNSSISKANDSFSVVDQAGSSTDSGWNMEEALDVEWAPATAPGANIVLVEARSASSTDLIAAINAAKAIPSVSVVSMSWGSTEFAGETTYDSVFKTPAGHTGITFLASSGDGGAGVEWPAASPNVVGVGGTSLVVNSSGTRISETYWSGSGGGTSKYEPEPSYQLNAQKTGHRSVPDVAAVADPNTGVIVVSGGTQYQVGGTSLSSPVWGAMIAIADQGLAVFGKGTLDGPTQTLPRLYAAPSAAFNDITSGPGSRATAGYDTVTGLGTPRFQNLVLFVDFGTTAFITTASTGGGTTIPSGTTTTTGSKGAGPIAPPQPPASWSPPRWWAARSVAYSARIAGTTNTIPGRPFRS